MIEPFVSAVESVDSHTWEQLTASESHHGSDMGVSWVR